MRNGKIIKSANLTDLVHQLVDCGVHGVFIAITELEVLVVDVDLSRVSTRNLWLDYSRCSDGTSKWKSVYCFDSKQLGSDFDSFFYQLTFHV